jgi:hypothetical protein
MIPVDQAMARKKRWNHIPLHELVTALNHKATGVGPARRQADADVAGACGRRPTLFRGHALAVGRPGLNERGRP